MSAATSHANPPAKLQQAAIDTHCHLFLLDREPQRVVDDARAAGVDTVICVGIDADSSRTSVEYAESLRGVFATAGIHPHAAADLDPAAGNLIEELAANPQVVGIGETGLDFFRMRSPRDQQERALRLHCSIAEDSGKPLVVHVREAWPAVLRLLDEEGAERVVLHCFSGDATIVAECAARGYYMSFAGNITYPKNEQLREAAAAVPVDRLLTETDSPFLSPQHRRGRDNAPQHVVSVVEELARVRGTDADAIAESTADNARAAFPGLR